tara:strand:- start:4279 stop:4692 length:414 start_codon:yes stop_codon:yes gene_type:complete
MDITDVRWPSLRESARRFLTATNTVLFVPIEVVTEAHRLVQTIADNLPSKLDLPKVRAGDFSVEGLASFGKIEPELDICWVPGCKWNDFFTTVIQLLDAGYPGCIGCGGVNPDEEWNEAARRSHFLVLKNDRKTLRY